MAAPQIVVRSSPKWQFLMALGLDGRNRNHQAQYWIMKSEAIRVYDAQLMGNRGALKAQYARELPPFSANQFSEEAFINAVNTIVNNACSQTRSLYDQGAAQGQPNWVARWVLYHVCRYRDGRNKKAARSQNFHDDDDENDDIAAQLPAVGRAEGTLRFTIQLEIRTDDK
ncbi:hypothetical protein HO133_002390 [Letharia lupina]|uniref:Uncharacterized protein n=1 Tax=Letharia lupina TaxID=560253 RepID=A0A8H6CDQ7_9LECA|nr:uncharacterized protein HO133_002390 [Letharia lupina]KAF6221534.1 hypothetical protein HO133_002390 [Letharia lupina]